MHSFIVFNVLILIPKNKALKAQDQLWLSPPATDGPLVTITPAGNSINELGVPAMGDVMNHLISEYEPRNIGLTHMLANLLAYFCRIPRPKPGGGSYLTNAISSGSVTQATCPASWNVLSNVQFAYGFTTDDSVWQTLTANIHIDCAYACSQSPVCSHFDFNGNMNSNNCLLKSGSGLTPTLVSSISPNMISGYLVSSSVVFKLKYCII